MEQQSAVEFLMKFCLNDLPIEQWNKYNGLFEQAKQMEKEQIVDAYRIASINNAPNEDMKNIKPEYWQVNAEMWYDKIYDNQNK